MDVAWSGLHSTRIPLRLELKEGYSDTKEEGRRSWQPGERCPQVVTDTEVTDMRLSAVAHSVYIGEGLLRDCVWFESEEPRRAV